MAQTKTMTDEEKIIAVYEKMYQAMIDKDRMALMEVHDDEYLLIHMTGMRQDKTQYIDSILDGTLNYFSKSDDGITVRVMGDKAKMTGHSRVTAAVFGGGKHTWRLAMDMDLVKRGEDWKILRSTASTY